MTLHGLIHDYGGLVSESAINGVYFEFNTKEVCSPSCSPGIV